MNIFSRSLLCIIGVSCVAAAAFAADVKVEEEEMGPASQDAKYCISPVGNHLATVVRKGSRMTVMLDNVAGPRFDEILTPTLSYIDPRGPNLEAQMAGTVVPNLYPQQQVVFSKDGKRFAYVARAAQEWVLMVDNKEMLRMPVPAAGPSTDFRVQFTGNEGKHLLFACGVFGGYELYVDGQKWPGLFSSGGGGSEGTVDPVISADGEHIAYVAQIDRNNRALILDGKDTGYMGFDLHFNPDGKHLISRIQVPNKGTSVLLDGKAAFTAKQVFAVYVPTNGNHIAAVLGHEYPDHSMGQFVVVDNKAVEATGCKAGVQNFVFSPDGKHYAALCSDAPNVFFVVIDGKKGQVYDGVGANVMMQPWKYFTFSQDSSKFGYIARSANKEFVVINDDESDAFENNAAFLFSPDGKHVIKGGNESKRNPNAPGGADISCGIYIDGKAERLGQKGFPYETLTYSPDMSRYAYFTGPMQFGGGTGAIFADGKATGITGNFNFSPDSKHLLAVGIRGSDNKNGIFVDDKFIYSAGNPIRYRAFTPDSQHLYWLALEPAKLPNAVPGTYENVVYLDGKAVARCERTDTGMLMKAISPMGSYQYINTSPGWFVGPDGVLTFFANSGDVVKRYRVTPSSDTSLTTMLAAAPAK